MEVTSFEQLVTSNPSDGLVLHNISSPDGSIRGSFLELGGSAYSLFVKDKDGDFRDVILGFDDFELYTQIRAQFGAAVGRYAGRIRNGTYSIPTTHNTAINNSLPAGIEIFHTTLNENNVTTLHGGAKGYDLRAWSYIDSTPHSLTLGLLDKNGTEGFGGSVYTELTYTLTSTSWHLRFLSRVLEGKTPVKLTSHAYWNLEGYHAYTNDTNRTFLDSHNLQLNADRALQVDAALLPTGEILDVDNVPGLDFRTDKPLVDHFVTNGTTPFCGPGCDGINICMIYEDDRSTKKPALTLRSVDSGINMDVYTNQPSVEVWTCEGIGVASLPRKASQGGATAGIYGSRSCVALEQGGWDDAINHPEWGQNQIYKEGEVVVWESEYRFSVV
ncbi:galactose mutarotase-like protein [Atractiella rhizophila]|nr:galactose mutarotase-like protein [Atractiella rhizophila]